MELVDDMLNKIPKNAKKIYKRTNKINGQCFNHENI